MANIVKLSVKKRPSAQRLAKREANRQLYFAGWHFHHHDENGELIYEFVGRRNQERRFAPRAEALLSLKGD
jgi:hypothetical protein